ncbi:MAG TPA: dihydrofolate reductase family protein [Candidatus Lokiarchaeia archaeon]|nr:dihydrofolate reductase family protein [Candidatus Lokiarchaeia archaeon]
MRKLVVLSFISLDGVMQAPGGPEEDPTGGFQHGGWTVPYFDDFLGKVMANQMSKPFDLLLGRKTYEIFASHWPFVEDDDPVGRVINNAMKYMVTRTPRDLDWQNSTCISGDVVQEITNLKASDGPDMQVHGSGDLIHTLLKHGLVDEFWLKIFPVILGTGKRLFQDGVIPRNLELLGSEVSPKGVIVASYAVSGEVRTGSFALESPNDEEIVQ